MKTRAKKYLYTGENVYKANMHCHTTCSDGAFTPEKIKEMYMAEGYSIVAFTDHNVLKSHQHLSDDGFLAIDGCEVDITQSQKEERLWQNQRTYHFNLYAKKPGMTMPPTPKMDYHDTDAINKYIADRAREGFLVSYNHPYWSLQTYEVYGRLRGCFAVEIYNHKCEVANGNFGYDPRVYDDMLRGGMRLCCLSADDNHNANQSAYDSFGGAVYINSKSLKYTDVLESLVNGDFYSSQGPEIYEISLEGRELTVKCSPAQSVTVYTRGRNSYRQSGEGIETAKFKLDGNEGYIRVNCRSKDYKDANSNAYWLESAARKDKILR